MRNEAVRRTRGASAAACGLPSDATSNLEYARGAVDASRWLPVELQAPANEPKITFESERLVPPDPVTDLVVIDAVLGEIILLGHNSDSEESEREGLTIL